jgi:hypothetical protein
MMAGSCHANFERAMELEHCSEPVSSWQFETSNYHVCTTPMQEWDIVLKSKSLSEEASQNERRIPNIENLLKLDSAKKAGLTRVEVIAVVMYTGPMVRTLIS